MLRAAARRVVSLRALLRKKRAGGAIAAACRGAAEAAARARVRMLEEADSTHRGLADGAFGVRAVRHRARVKAARGLHLGTVLRARALHEAEARHQTHLLLEHRRRVELEVAGRHWRRRARRRRLSTQERHRQAALHFAIAFVQRTELVSAATRPIIPHGCKQRDNRT